MKSTLIALIASAAALVLAPAKSIAQEQPVAADKSGYVEANGINYYYEIRGDGEPLLLLHGGLGSMDMFAPIMPRLAADRKVITVDLHGHGRTELGDRQVNLIDMGNDMATILNELGFEKVDVMGYSLGGGVAFRLAVQHPEAVRRAVFVSAGFARDGFYPEMLPQQASVSGQMADMMKDTPMYTAYMAVAPHPEEFPKLLDSMGALMREPYNWADDVKSLKTPVMLVFGDSDMYRPEHIVEFYQLLGGGLKDAGWMRENMSQNRLAIIPGRTHYDMFLSPQLADTALPFINGDMAASDWTGKAGGN